MGIEIVRLGEHNPTSTSPFEASLANVSYQEFFVPHPQMNVWMAYVDNNRPLFPWWGYNSHVDEDMTILKQMWDVLGPQSLFDCLFLSSLQKNAGGNFYIIFPGIIKSQNWANVKPGDRSLYLSGQACMYHLTGLFEKKLTIQWVPFWQPQSLVKDPYFISMWRLFRQISVDEASRCLTFFKLSDPSKLPKILTLLNDAEEKRSEKLSELVDWFGMYSSPLQDAYRTGCIVYGREKASLQSMINVRNHFDHVLREAQRALSKQTEPRAVLRFLSGHIAL